MCLNAELNMICYMLTYNKKLRIGYCFVCFLVCIYVFEIKTAANVMFMNIRHLGDTLFASLHNNQPNLKSGKKSHKYLRIPWRGHERAGQWSSRETIPAPPRILAVTSCEEFGGFSWTSYKDTGFRLGIWSDSKKLALLPGVGIQFLMQILSMKIWGTELS